MSFTAYPRIRLFALISALLVLFCYSSFPVAVAAISRGYQSDDNLLVPGMVVALSADSTDKQSKVERAAQGSENRVVGIATDSEDSLVIVASASSDAYIESEGEVQAYVSDISGQIKKGDLLAVSPLKGILMRITTESTTVVAVAAEDFSSSKAEKYEIIGNEKKSALVQKLRVSLDYKGSSAQGSSESPLQKVGKALVGKDIGSIRPLIALIIFFILMITEGAILYSTISSSISSVGRNPLAKNIIMKELTRVLTVVVVVLIVGMVAMYGVLWF